MDLNEARKRLPELAGLSDESALNVIHQVYYPTMEKSALAERLGYKSPPPPAPERSMVRAAGDLGLQFGGGVVSGVRMMSDLFGADNAVSGGLRGAEDALRQLQSAAAKADQQRIAEIMKEAENKGFADQVVAGVKAFGQAPAAMIAQALGTSIPTLATALIPGGAAARLAGAAGVGAAQGAGNIKGVIYEEVKNNPLPGETPEQTEFRAARAQEYGGQNAGQIALGGGLGALAGSTGMERTLAGLRNGVTQAAPGMAARVGMGAAAEAVPEIAQGGQEKLASNLALRNEGFDVDPMAGVVAGATMEGLAGGVMGGAFGVPNPSVQNREPLPQPQPAPPVEPAGPMTRALNTIGPRITNTLTSDLLGRNTDPLAGQIAADRLAAEDSAVARNQFADRNGAMLAGGGLEGSRADPLANMLADARTAEANSFTNVQQAASRRPPMPASDAARILDEAKARGMDMTAAPHPDGGFVVVPRQWVTPDVAAQAETEIADTLSRMQQADAAPVQRAERRKSEPVDLSLNTDPVAGYIEDLRNTNTPAARAYVGEFDAGRVTRADVEQRMQADRGLTADERLERAAAEGLKLNPKGNPFKTLMAANLEAKTTPGTVIEVPGGYAIRPKESTLANTAAQEVPEADAAPVQADEPAQAVSFAGAADEAGTPAVSGSDEQGAVQALSGYEQAKAVRDAADARVKAASNAMQKYPRGAMGLTPDDVKATPQWKADKAEMDAAMRDLQNANGVISKKFAKESKAEREARRAANVQDAPQGTDGTLTNEGTIPEAAAVEAPAPARGDGAAAAGVPDAGAGAGVRADGVKKAAKKKAILSPAVRAAFESVGIDPDAPVDKAAKLRRDADKLAAEARKMLDGIPPGQPVMSTRDRNLRDRSGDKMRKAGDLLAEADRLDAEKAKSADPAQKTAESEQVEPFEHAGLKIRTSRVKEGDQVVDRWVVQSPENAEREARGERQIGGDRIVETREQAIKTAEQEVKRYAKEKADRAEIDAQDKARRDADEAKKEANRGKTLLERRADAILDKPGKFPASAGLGLGTKREAMDKAIEQGRLVTEVMVDDTAAKKRDQDAVDAVRRAGYILGASNENIPVVKKGLEAQARLKEGKYQKPEYRVYQGSDRNGSFFEITKTEYDYVQKAKANPPAESKPDQEAGPEPRRNNDAAPASSRDGQIRLANRGSRIATLKMLNNQLMKLDPNAAWSEAAIEGAADGELDSLQDAISSALMAAQRGEQGGKAAEESELRAELEALSGAELRAIFDRMGLAGSRMTATERVNALMAEDAAEVRAAMNGLESPTDQETKTKEEPQKPTPPKATELTPKQFHDAKLAYIAADTGADMAEVREMYDTEGGRADHQREWLRDVEAAAKAGETLTRQTLDKLYELAPTTRLPETAIPAGYQRPEARKAEAEEAQARIDNRKAAKESVKAGAAQEFTAADAKAAERQLAQMIGDRIDAMQAQAVQKIGAKFLPTMGIKAPIGKAKIKAAVTDFTKVNPLAAASEFGVEIADAVRAPLLAQFEGRLVDAAKPAAPAQQEDQQTTDDRAKPEPVAPIAAKVDDFGEKLPPARRAMAAKLSEELTDDAIASQPLSKVWPLEENEAIEDTFAAAVAHVMREAVPAKPRTSYKVKSWVSKVKVLRDFAAKVMRGAVTKEKLIGEMEKVYSLRDLASKIKLLEQIDRAQWKRIGDVSEAPGAIKYVDGKAVPQPSASVTVDGKSHWFRNSGDINAHVDAIKAMLTGDAPESKLKFEVYRATTGDRKVFISKKGDKEYRRLMEFDTAEEARKALKDQYADLVTAWEGIKSRDNITERDLRTAENRPRTGKDHRQGRDISAEEFQQTFGFRGGEFGKWVSQGSGAQERQFMLNSAYDALMDLSDIIGVPPKAISLDGTLGVAFGSRGGGWASAHFEPSNLVINLTKPRGAGALAHEWFHALDNYFARKRGGEVPIGRSLDAQNEYRRNNFITHKTRPMMVRKDGKGSPVTRERLAEWRKSSPGSAYLNEDQWIEDPNHKPGVRAEVEERFDELVKALDASPMLKRARKIDGVKLGDGYWSRTLERAARAFENYIQVRMHEQGYNNDFLVNVKPAVDVGKSLDRYPYLLPSEVAPIADAFSNLFNTIQTKEEDGKTVMFSIDDGTAPADTADYGPATQAHRDAAARLAESFADRIEGGGSHTDLLDAVAPGDGKRGQAAAAVANIARRLFRRQVVFVKFKGAPLFNGVVSKSVPGVIFLNIDSQKPLLSVLGHELLHEMAKSHPTMYANLSRRLDDLIKNETEYAIRTYNAYKKAGISTKGLDTREELEADIVGDNFMDAGFWQAMGENQPGLFKRIVNFVTKWLDNLSQKIADYRPFGTDEFLTDIAAARDAVASAMREFSGAEAGAVADPVDGDVKLSAAEKQDQADNADIRFSVVDDIRKAIPAFDVKTAPKNSWAHYRGMAMQALGRRQIVDLYAEELPQLEQYDYLVQQMDAEKNDSGAEADKLAQDWGKLKDEKQLAELMHDATLAQIDPAKPMETGVLQAQYRELKARFDALTPEAQDLYRQARDMYDGHYRKVQKAIKERIERSEMSAGQKRQIMARMDEELFKKLKGVYFPLARFGQYVIVVKDANGEVKNVTRAESVNEAEEARKELHKAFPKHMGYTVGKVLKQAEFNAGRDAVGKGFMADLMDALDAKGIDDELRDTVAQLYLSSLPDLSWAKHGIHRKGTPGFSQDARRAFAQNMFHGARYLAKLRYADQLQDELIAMQDHVKAYEGVDEYDSIQAQQVVDEMVKRHEIMMNPKASPVSTALTSFGFVFHLGLSPASAMVNMSQTALVAYPMMGAKWGWGKASAALLAASQDVVKAKNDLGTILKGAELDAYERAVKDGTIDVTMAHDLAGISQGEDQKVFWKIRPVMRAASFMFHHAERFNRQATFIAAWRMAKEAGPNKTADQLYEEAKKLTYDSHFDYAASNRPRVMQGNWQRVIFLFKQYAQAMVYTLSRNAYLSVKGASPADRKMARKTLGGILAAHAAAAGVLGLPIVGPLLTAASFLGSDDDEPWDAEVAMQNLMADMVGPKAAEVMARGFSRLTPFDLSGRVAINKLILPDVQEGLEGKQWAESAMAAALGPVAGIGVNWARGFQKITEGHYAMGIEDMMPTALRGPLRAMRYASEGAVDKSGVVIVDEVGPGSIAGQALGFSPSEVRRATERKAAIMDYDRSLADRRSALVRQWAEAQMNGDTDGVKDVMAEIQGFNKKNPDRKITMPNLIQSVRARRRRIEQAEDGIYLPKSREGAREAVRF